MKLATFTIKETGRTTIGAYLANTYIDLAELSGDYLPASMIEFLKLGDSAMERARSLVEKTEKSLEAKPVNELSSSSGNRYVFNEDEIELQSPVPLPGKIVHTSCNFDSHLAELTTWNDPEWESHNWKDFSF